jgi:integral membrane sensor domain MASE1
LWIAVAGVLPANLAFDLIHGRPFVLSLAFVVANTASAAFGAQLLLRAGSPERLFASARRSLRTFLLLVVVPLPGAAIGSLALERLIGHSIALVPTAAAWWASDLLALYVIVPLLVVVRETRSPLDRRRWVEGVAAFAALFAISFWLFGRSIPDAAPAQHPFWLIPVLVWIGLRFGRRGAGLATFLLALIASWATAQGLGSFAAAASHAESAVVLQLFLCVSSAIAVSLAASMRSLEVSIDDLQRQRSELQQALDEIRTLRGLIPICAHCRKLRDDAGLWQSLERYLSSHTEAQLTHGLCPQCLDDLYPELHGDD